LLLGISEESKRNILRDSCVKSYNSIYADPRSESPDQKKEGKGKGSATVIARIGLAGTFLADFALKRRERLVLVDFLLRHDFVETMLRGTEVAVSL
jgi:hypothetical protein